LALTAVALGAGLWLSAMNLRYRDVMSALPFAMQVLLFCSPVAYSSSLIPEQWRLLYALNPLAGLLEAFRSILLGRPYGSWAGLAVSLSMALVLLTTGVIFFRGREASFADEV